MISRYTLLVIMLCGITDLFAQTLKPYHYSSAQAFHVYGPVKTMTISSGDILRFDINGEIVDEDLKPAKLIWFEEGVHYISPYPYDNFLIITFPEPNVREEKADTESTAAKYERKYEFDADGRIIRRDDKRYVWHEISEYFYRGGEKQPFRVKIEQSTDAGTARIVVDYTYKGFDDYGNWTIRKVNATWKYQVTYSDDEVPPPFLEQDPVSFEQTAVYEYHSK